MEEGKEQGNSNNVVDSKKPFYHKWWFWVLVVIVILGIINTIADQPRKVGEINSEEQGEVDDQIFGVGDKVQVRDTVLSVDSVEANWESESSLDRPSTPDNIFVVVTVTLENQGDKELDLRGFWDFELEDANGVLRKNKPFAGAGLNKLVGSAINSLSSGGTITGDLIFEVPEDSTAHLILHYKPAFSGQKSILINLL